MLRDIKPQLIAGRSTEACREYNFEAGICFMIIISRVVHDSSYLGQGTIRAKFPLHSERQILRAEHRRVGNSLRKGRSARSIEHRDFVPRREFSEFLFDNVQSFADKLLLSRLELVSGIQFGKTLLQLYETICLEFLKSYDACFVSLNLKNTNFAKF